MIFLAIIFFLIVFAVLVLTVADTIRGKGRFGINFKVPNCPNCGEKLPAVRKPKSFSQAMWGGSTCEMCQTEVDKWGKIINSNSESKSPPPQLEQAETEGEAGIDLRIDAAGFENVGMHHSGAAELDPARAFARAAALAVDLSRSVAFEAGEIELRRRLCEREVRRPKPRHGVFAEKAF